MAGRSVRRFWSLGRRRLHPQMGLVRRSHGTWRGSLALGDSNAVPVILGGDRHGPDRRHAMLAVELGTRWVELEPLVRRHASFEPESFSLTPPIQVEVVATPEDDAINLRFRPPTAPVMLRNWATVNAPTSMTIADVFDGILDANTWLSTESRSGVGSERLHTARVVAALPSIFAQFGIASMLDVPCGDFNWMQDVELGDVSYVGADIVERLVAENAARFTRPGVRFERLDVVVDPLPRSDLVLCRDCLVHLRSDEVFQALANIVASGSLYLLTTTFTERPENVDIRTGQWRPLNLECPPYSLPPPLFVLDEGFLEDRGRWADKSLALWSVDDLRIRLDAFEI